MGRFTCESEMSSPCRMISVNDLFIWILDIFFQNSIMVKVQTRPSEMTLPYG